MKILDVLKMVWGFVNGKKTNIGTIIMLVSWGLLQMGASQEVADQTIDIVQKLYDAGAFTAIVGLIHKLIKQMAEKE